MSSPLWALAMLATCCLGCTGPRDPVGQVASSATTTTMPARPDEVTVSGRVTMSYGAHLFTVGEGHEEVVVVVVDAVAPRAGAPVEATGRVCTFDRRQLEEELGVELGPDTAALEGQPCLFSTTARIDDAA
jgi:hypothetical protein